MNDIEKKKLLSIFKKKYTELLFSDEKFFKTWSDYIFHIGCEKTLEHRFVPDKYSLPDPCVFGGFILIPIDLALKILAIGLP
jgi:hypothetical protein